MAGAAASVAITCCTDPTTGRFTSSMAPMRTVKGSAALTMRQARIGPAAVAMLTPVPSRAMACTSMASASRATVAPQIRPW